MVKSAPLTDNSQVPQVLAMQLSRALTLSRNNNK